MPCVSCNTRVNFTHDYQVNFNKVSQRLYHRFTVSPNHPHCNPGTYEGAVTPILTISHPRDTLVALLDGSLQYMTGV